jgi:hypothetical protein
MDIHELHALFNIADKAGGHPNLSAIKNWALAKLAKEAETLEKGQGEPSIEEEQPDE